MPIISHIGRRSTSTRLLVGGIYAVLMVGSVTMIYPFWLMLVGATKSTVDAPESKVIPAFYTSHDALWAKYTESLFNEHVASMRLVHNRDSSGFRRLAAPDPAAFNADYTDAWEAFLHEQNFGPECYEIGHLFAPRSHRLQTLHLRKIKAGLRERFDGDLAGLNAGLHTAFADWGTVSTRAGLFLNRVQNPVTNEFGQVINDFRQTVDLPLRYYGVAEGFYKFEYLHSQFTKDIAEFNRVHGTRYAGYDDLRLDRRLPAGANRTAAERETWEYFVRKLLNLLWIRVDDSATDAYRAYLTDAWLGKIERLNQAYGTRHPDFAAIPLPNQPPNQGRERSDWAAFIEGWKGPGGREHRAPIESLSIDDIGWRFRDHLQQTYTTVDAANDALGTGATNFIDFYPPQLAMHYRYFEANTGSIRWEFTVRNFLTVFEFLVLRGRALFNTVIYCLLAVLGALFVNPLAAYALSRYRPPSTYKLLLIMMLTMAFPPMVGMVPQFLMLREFHMLNTFWALVLPGLASGYFIFLLKGFFDSLPRELYESAELDGAGEIRIFLAITMSLSKPVLAVIALGAFNVAYSNFMFALLICQDQDMWTIMPWLYQMQIDSGQGVIFASLVVSAIPTFLIFAFCQNVIMRGIVVPVEK